MSIWNDKVIHHFLPIWPVAIHGLSAASAWESQVGNSLRAENLLETYAPRWAEGGEGFAGPWVSFLVVLVEQ